VRIAYVVDAWPKLSETFVVREVTAAAERHEVSIVSLTRPEAGTPPPEAGALADRVVHLDSVPSGRRHAAMRAARHPKRFRTALRAARAARPEGTMRRLPALLSVGERLRRDGVERIHAHFARWATAAAEVLSAWTGAPFGFTAHAYDLFEGTVRLPEKAARASWRVVCSQAGRDEIARRHGEEVAARFAVIRHGVDLDAWSPGPRRDRKTPLRVLAVGSCVEKKGFDVYVEALARLASAGTAVEARLVGGGPLLDALRAQAATTRASRVLTFDGARMPGEVREAMRGWADVLVLPARVDARGNRDGLPNVVGEAMACGLPVLGTAVGGLGDMLVHGETGLVVPVDDAASLAHAISVMATDPALRERLGRAARAKAEAVFDARKNLDAFLALVEAGGPA
jgi:glycosyltransferase involved in cell wall biosynthesis